MERMDSKSLKALQRVCEEESPVHECQKRIDRGDFSKVEEALISQALILEEVFGIYVEKMITTEFLGAQEIFSRIAFRAQSQALKTISTIAELKNPKKLTFIKQQNNAQFNLNQKKNVKQTFKDQVL